MKPSDLIELEKVTMAEVVKRRGLGGYSTEAEGLLLLNETMLKVLGHLIDLQGPPEATPRPKK